MRRSAVNRPQTLRLVLSGPRRVRFDGASEIGKSRDVNTVAGIAVTSAPVSTFIVMALPCISIGRFQPVPWVRVPRNASAVLSAELVESLWLEREWTPVPRGD